MPGELLIESLVSSMPFGYTWKHRESSTFENSCEQEVWARCPPNLNHPEIL